MLPQSENTRAQGEDNIMLSVYSCTYAVNQSQKRSPGWKYVYLGAHRVCNCLDAVAYDSGEVTKISFQRAQY
jgi:hypothetical protein